MFVKRALIIKINELYFKGKKDLASDLVHLDKDFSMDEVMNNLAILIALDEDRSEFARMHYDLLHYDEGNFKSKFAISQEIPRMNFSKKIKKAFPLTGAVAEVASILKKLSPKACLVGGGVRDSILGLTPKDFDFVTDTHYDELISVFEEEGFTVKETGKNFLVMNVIKNREEIEIANFRKDGTYEDGRRPESVDVGTLEDDAQRRDFTVNALYFRLSDERLLDPSGQGIPDIKERTLRFVGKAEDRLQEDALRLFRFYRFLKKGFIAAPKDLRSVRTLFKETYERTDPARAMQEIEKLVGL